MVAAEAAAVGPAEAFLVGVVALVAAEPEGVGDMRARDFIEQIDRAKIVEAVRVAEARSSGEIRVFITRKDVSDPVEEARNHFHSLGMAKTVQRNGILLLVAPRTQRFAIWGDTGIHDKCGTETWEALAAQMAHQFKAGNYTDGIAGAVEQAGGFLAQHFPRKAGDKNELSDEVAGD